MSCLPITLHFLTLPTHILQMKMTQKYAVNIGLSYRFPACTKSKFFHLKKCTQTAGYIYTWNACCCCSIVNKQWQVSQVCCKQLTSNWHCTIIAIPPIPLMSIIFHLVINFNCTKCWIYHFHTCQFPVLEDKPQENRPGLFSWVKQSDSLKNYIVSQTMVPPARGCMWIHVWTPS